MSYGRSQHPDAPRAVEYLRGRGVSGEVAAELPTAVKICLYRFVQEGLNNAWNDKGH